MHIARIAQLRIAVVRRTHGEGCIRARDEQSRAVGGRKGNKLRIKVRTVLLRAQVGLEIVRDGR